MAETAKLICSFAEKINYLEELLTMKSMKSMKGMKFKTIRKTVFFLDFMIFMSFLVKCFFAMKVDCLCCTQGFAVVVRVTNIMDTA